MPSISPPVRRLAFPGPSTGGLARPLAAFVALLLVGVEPAAAQTFWGSIVVGPEQVRAALDDPSLVVLHFGTDEDFRAGRIPGARLRLLR